MPTYKFTGKLFKEGNRSLIKVPFNVWEKFNLKGLIQVNISIENHHFECRLIPKGKGLYYIPIAKNLADQIGCFEVNVSLETLDELSRINTNSPYSLKHPIRVIDHIQSISYSKDGYCGQLCLAMLTGLSIDEIISITHMKAWQCSMSKLIEALDYFGIAHEKKMTYTKGKEFNLPKCCIVNVRCEPLNHLVLYYDGTYYDTMDIDYNQIIGFIKIHVK